MPFCKHVVSNVIFVPLTDKTGQRWSRGGDNKLGDTVQRNFFVYRKPSLISSMEYIEGGTLRGGKISHGYNTKSNFFSRKIINTIFVASWL